MTLRERNRMRTAADVETAALELFERHGYDRTTVEQIAARAGISSATFFRHFRAKEDVLFSGEDVSAGTLVALVAQRRDRRRTVAALADPVCRFAHRSVADPATDGQRLTHLVMTTPALEARSLRLRLRWEREIAAQLAREAGTDRPDLGHTLVAAVAVSCLTSALRAGHHTGASIAHLTRQAFACCTDLTC
ncbi:TetR family transcriptional regulator [Amycolatopsis sp. NPDC051128]|uniref:TetR/AcrR family transcriptional regulator n=1 Tax=Amycolatopsis sp. NPDC051128 TaxID=3155412 RepID=UPI003430A779